MVDTAAALLRTNLSAACSYNWLRAILPAWSQTRICCILQDHELGLAPAQSQGRSSFLRAHSKTCVHKLMHERGRARTWRLSQTQQERTRIRTRTHTLVTQRDSLLVDDCIVNFPTTQFDFVFEFGSCT